MRKPRRLTVEIMLLMLLAGMLIGKSAASNYGFFDPLADVHFEITKYFVDEPDEKAMLQGAMEGMISTLNDPHTIYMSPEMLDQFDMHTRASFTGIGAQISRENETGPIYIVTPLEDSPAYKAGVKAGDIILEIDGQSAQGLSVSEAVERIIGPEGTQVKLKVRHTDGVEAVLDITRQRIQIQTVKGFNRKQDQHWDYIVDHDHGIGYIRVTDFVEPTTEALREAVVAALDDGMKGMILDLRFNPGGLLEQATDMADLFLSKGVIVSTSGRNRAEHIYRAEPHDELGDFPLVVLINEASASASEVVAGALKDNQRAVIIGTRSYGKGSVQEVHALAGGFGAIKVTTALYYLPSGRNIHKREKADTWGVDPNDGFYVPMSAEQIRKMIDLRFESDVVRAENGQDAPAPVTPELIEQQLSDPQLAAALKTMQAKLQTGKFIEVGLSNATLQAHLSEKSDLERSRDLLMEQLDKINQRLRALDEKVAGGEPAQASDDQDAPAEGEPRPDRRQPDLIAE